jgi:hypothetical protein
VWPHRIATFGTLLEFRKTQPCSELDTDADSMHKGVLDNRGNQLVPQFDHHVDNNIYADVGKHMYTTVCSSVLALWLILGFPHDDTPGPLSRENFCGRYTHVRTTLGHHVDSRK